MCSSATPVVSAANLVLRVSKSSFGARELGVVGVSRRGSRTGQRVARGAAEGLATGSSFFHDSLATDGKGGTLHEGPTRTDLQTFRWASRSRKEDVVSSGISNERNVDGVRCIGRCSNAASHHGLLVQVPGYIHAGAGNLDGRPLEYLDVCVPCWPCWQGWLLSSPSLSVQLAMQGCAC